MEKLDIKAEHASRPKHFERPTTEKPPALFSLIILTSIIGVLTGGAGFWLVQSLAGNQLISTNFNNLDNKLSVNVEQPMTNLAEKYSPSVAGVYKKTAKLADLKNHIFSSTDYLGAATVITSDGWLMTTDQVLKNTEALVALGDNIYAIEEFKSDVFTGLNFIKINANFLSPIDFQLASDIKIGEKLFTNVDLPNVASHAFYTSYLSNNRYVVDKILSTDKVDYYLKTDANLTADLNLLAVPYFNTQGDVLGVAYKQEKDLVLIPAEYLKQAVKHLLDKTKRVAFGLRYVDLENNSGFLAKGNVVYSQPLVAVEPNSVAFRAGFKTGDQIVAVNNDVISSHQSLTAILQNYRVGDKVMIRVLRNQVEQDIEVQL